MSTMNQTDAAKETVQVIDTEHETPIDLSDTMKFYSFLQETFNIGAFAKYPWDMRKNIIHKRFRQICKSVEVLQIQVKESQGLKEQNEVLKKQLEAFSKLAVLLKEATGTIEGVKTK